MEKTANLLTKQNESSSKTIVKRGNVLKISGSLRSKIIDLFKKDVSISDITTIVRAKAKNTAINYDKIYYIAKMAK